MVDRPQSAISHQAVGDAALREELTWANWRHLAAIVRANRGRGFPFLIFRSAARG